MQRKTRRIIAALGVIVLLVAVGAAFTTSIGGALDGKNANIGFGSETITGATATAVNYALDANGEYIHNVAVTLQHDFSSGYTFTASLTDATDQYGSGVNLDTGTCTAGSYDSTNDVTPITCDFTSYNSGAGVYVDGVEGFQMSVTGNNSGGTTQTLGTGSAIH